jgi:predicted ATPase
LKQSSFIEGFRCFNQQNLELLLDDLEFFASILGGSVREDQKGLKFSLQIFFDRSRITLTELKKQLKHLSVDKSG